MVTEYCWGTCWGDDTLDRKRRSMLNLGMIAAMNRMHEWELHFRGAIGNGLTRAELKAILTQIAVYCGIPVGVECFRIAKKVFDELDGLNNHGGIDRFAHVDDRERGHGGGGVGFHFDAGFRSGDGFGANVDDGVFEAGVDMYRVER